MHIRHMRSSGTAVVVLWGAAAILGCPKDEDEPPGQVGTATKRRVPELKVPAERLPREREEKVLQLLNDLRGVDADYLARVKAQEQLAKLIGEGEKGIVPYMVQLLDDPQWDVRASTLRMLIRYGRDCPEAVAALVQAIGDMSMSAAVRDHAATALRTWTGKQFGYNAWDREAAVKTAAAKWKEWLEQTGGHIVPPAGD